MTRLRGPGLRRPLLIYFAAVVGPTLIVLTLSLLTVGRQADAVRALAATTARLHEQRVQVDIERLQHVSASAALTDPSVQQLGRRLTTAFGSELDGLRAEVAHFRRRHPIVHELFVAGPEGVRYPRLQPPLSTHAQLMAAESEAARRLLAAAEILEDSNQLSSAILAYERAGRLARSGAGRALATQRLARLLEAGGQPERATEVWRRLVTAQPSAYSSDGRPYTLVAAMQLSRLSKVDAALLDGVRSDLINGRWSVTPGQFDYFLATLGPPTPGTGSSGFRQWLAFSRRLHAAYPKGHSAPAGDIEVASISVEGVVDLLALTREPASSTVTGVSLDPSWIRDTILRSIEADRSDASSISLSPPAAAAVPFRAGPLPWNVAVRPYDASAWRRRDVVVFGAGVVAVVGVLVMGVVLLTRDVAREAELNRLRADLVSGVSHELKAPLTVIRMYAETIRDAVPAETPEKSQFAETIVQETDRLHRLIDDVVDFSRIQQGQRAYRLVAGDVAAVIERTAGRFAEYARLHGLRLDVEIPANLPAIRFDASAVEQAIMNLLDNAAKYSADSTDIGLRVFVQEAEIGIEVADQGLGIPPGDQGRIFERFRRGEHRDRGGYGLGLYLVRHIVEAHGGRVHVWSEPGSGSRFTLYLPMEPAQAAHA